MEEIFWIEDKIVEAVLSNFVESLSELLIQANLKQTELAKAIGCGKGTISRYMKMQKLPSVDVLVRIADYFACSTDYLLGREYENPAHAFLPCPPFQERLPLLCKQLKITKYKLKKETGIAESAIYSWQSGRTSPNLLNVIKIADTFGFTVDFVLGRSN